MAAAAAAAATAVAGAAEKEASQQSSLGAYSPVDYMSITSFPRLPEEEPGSGSASESCLRSRKEEDAFLGEQDTGESGIGRPSCLPARLDPASSTRASIQPRLHPSSIPPAPAPHPLVCHPSLRRLDPEYVVPRLSPDDHDAPSCVILASEAADSPIPFSWCSPPCIPLHSTADLSAFSLSPCTGHSSQGCPGRAVP